MRKPVRKLLGVLFLALVSCAIALRAQQGQPAPPTQPSPTFAALDKMADEVAQDVEKLRGWTFKHPVRRERVNLDGVRSYIQHQIDATLPAPRRALLQAFLRTAGLIPADCDLVATELKVLDQQVAGYYDPAAGTLFLVDRPEPMPAFMQRAVLAHELTHALDDQYVGIDKLTRPEEARTEDADLVLASLGEGSATALMFHYLAGQMAAGKVNPLEAGAYFTREMARAKALAEMPRYFNAMFGSYMVGAAFLGKGDLPQVLRLPDDKGIGDNFRAAWAKPPRSSEQILHPEKYWDEASRDEPVVIDDRVAEKWLAANGRHVVHRNTLGELLTALLTEPRDSQKDVSKLMTGMAAWTNAGAMGWGGDRFYLLASGGSEADAQRDLRNLEGVWVTAWDSSADRDEFVRALGAGYSPDRSVVAGSGTKVAVVFIGFDAAARQALLERLRSAPLQMTKDGKPWT